MPNIAAASPAPKNVVSSLLVACVGVFEELSMRFSADRSWTKVGDSVGEEGEVGESISKGVGNGGGDRMNHVDGKGEGMNEGSNAKFGGEEVGSIVNIFTFGFGVADGMEFVGT